MFILIVIIKQSRVICPKMMTRAPIICDGNAIHIVGVDVSNIISTSLSETISGVVLVAPSLSRDLAVANAVKRVCNT